MEPLGTLEILLVSGIDLKNVQFIGKQDPFCVLSCETNRARSITHQDGGRHPVWNQTFVFQNISSRNVLNIEIFDENYFSRETKIGYSKIKLKTVVEEGFEDVQAPVYDDVRNPYGFIKLQLKFRPQGSTGSAVRRRPARTLTAANPELKFADFYTIDELLSESEDGITRTYQVTHVTTRKRHACKVVNKRKLSTAVQDAAVQQELVIHKELSALPHVVRFDQSFEDDRYVYIVTELCPGGDLIDHVTNSAQMSEAEAARVIRGVLSVVAHCHSKGIALRGLQPEHIMFTSNSHDAQVKVANFSAATHFKPGDTFFDVHSDIYYCAPEMLRKKYGKEVDIWSCGIILYVLLAGRYPFTGTTYTEVAESILTRELDLRQDPWPRISAPAKDCVRRLLVRDPTARPAAQELVEHDWIREGGTAGHEEIHGEVLKKLKSFQGRNKFSREAKLLLARNLPATELQRLEGIFKNIDKDGSGTITLAELRQALQANTSMKEDELESLLKDADMDGDGTLDYHEFMAATLKLEKLNREEHFREAFEHFDLDGNGYISMDELKIALKNLNVAEMEKIIEDVDQNDDGQIDYKEFCVMMANVL